MSGSRKISLLSYFPRNPKQWKKQEVAFEAFSCHLDLDRAGAASSVNRKIG